MHLLSIYISAIPSPVAPVGRRRALTCRRQVVFREPTSIGATGCNRTDVIGRMQPDGCDRIKKEDNLKKLPSLCMQNEISLPSLPQGMPSGASPVHHLEQADSQRSPL